MNSYLNGVIGSVNTILKGLYAHEYSTSSAQSNITSLVFAGEGMSIPFHLWINIASWLCVCAFMYC